MQLYVIRHADAAPESPGGDSERPLTAKGEEQARALGTALAKHGVELRLVLSSPLLRARQTADAMLKDWPEPRPELRVYGELALGGKRRKLLKSLREQSADKVAVVGHEPELVELITFLRGSKRAQLNLGKAAVAHLACDAQLKKGDGQLQWLLTPDWYGERSEGKA